jgi:hypothetical protein
METFPHFTLARANFASPSMASLLQAEETYCIPRKKLAAKKHLAKPV